MKVHYLCHPPNDSLNFVYATELPRFYYAPGLFCVESLSSSGSLPETFQFPAQLNQQLINTELTHSTARTYVVSVEDLALKFFFKLVSLDKKSRYVGDDIEHFEGLPLYRVQPANDERLERACLNSDFYFVGFGGNAMDQEND